MRIKVLIFSLFSLFLLSCSEDVAKEFLGKRTPIELTASVTSQKKALTRTTDLELNSSAGFTLSSTAAYNKVCVNIDGDEFVYSITGEESETTGTTLEYDQTQPYFPLGETSVSVSARYPDYESDISRSDGTTFFTIQEDQTTQDAYLRSDLMTATAIATRAQQADGTWAVTEAELEFHHMMAKLIINVSSEDETILKVKKVLVNNVKPRVPMTGNNYAVGAATTSSESTKYNVIAFKPDELLEGEGNCAVILPAQTFQGAFVTVTMDFKNPYNGDASEDVDVVYYYPGAGKEFVANTVYTMNIVVGIDNILLHDGSKADNKVDISAWIPASATTINIFPTVVHTLLNEFGDIQDIPTQTYIGEPIRLSSEDLVVKATKEGATTTLTLNQDYTVTYENNIEAGTATVTAVGIGLYSGMTSKEFTIAPRDITSEDVVITAFPETTYNGEEKRLAVILRDNAINKSLHLDTDYELEYPEDVTNAGEKEVTINGITNYTGTRTATYTVKKAQGYYQFADQLVRSYVPTGKTVAYTNALTITRGQGSITSATSSNTNVATVSSNGTVTLKGAGSTTISLTVSDTNWAFDNYQYTIDVKSGPILPIMYVAPYNMTTTTAMATDNSSLSSCYFPWNPETMEGFDIRPIKKNGITKDGIHYHLPSQREWSSIVPIAEVVLFGGEESTQLNQTENVAFGVTTTKSSQVDESDYSYAVTNTTWTSDYYSNGVNTTYALRFKGSNYCCAYRYDYLWNLPANIPLTGNRTGPSLLIRVIYKGSSYTYPAGKDVKNLANEDWDHPEFTVVLPCSGYQIQGMPAGVPYRESMSQGGGYYYSATPTNANKTNYYAVYINESKARANYSHYSNGYSVRLFRDAY